MECTAYLDISWLTGSAHIVGPTIAHSVITQYSCPGSIRMQYRCNLLPRANNTTLHRQKIRYCAIRKNPNHSVYSACGRRCGLIYLSWKTTSISVYTYLITMGGNASAWLKEYGVKSRKHHLTDGTPNIKWVCHH